MPDTDPADGPDFGPDQQVIVAVTEPVESTSGPVTLAGDVVLLPGRDGWRVFKFETTP